MDIGMPAINTLLPRMYNGVINNTFQIKRHNTALESSLAPYKPSPSCSDTNDRLIQNPFVARFSLHGVNPRHPSN